jgi:glycosyltransferase involved in cell wall biosynthesis
MVSEFERLTAAQPFDLVTAMAMPVAPYVLGRRRAPILLDVESSQTLQLEERYREAAGRLARQRYKIAWRKSLNYEVNAIRAVQTATFVSQKEVDYYAPHLGTQSPHQPSDAHRMAVIPNGVELQPPTPAAEPASAHQHGNGSAGIIFNGALTYHANFDAMQYFLAEIYPRVRQAVPGASLTITGSTQGVALDALKTDGSVHFSGYVDDVRRLVADADVCVTPLRRGGGTRLKILEAMAVGTPVVSTAKGCEGLDAQPGVHLLVGDDPQAFADYVIHLLNDAKARALISGQARRLVEDRYDWRAIGARFIELAEKTAQSPLERQTP